MFDDRAVHPSLPSQDASDEYSVDTDRGAVPSSVHCLICADARLGDTVWVKICAESAPLSGTVIPGLNIPPDHVTVNFPCGTHYIVHRHRCFDDQLSATDCFA
jgi:hypothetical protein